MKKISSKKGSRHVGKVIGMIAGISALVIGFCPYEIRVEKGHGVDVKAVIPRVTYEKDVKPDGKKIHNVRIRWFSWDL